MLASRIPDIMTIGPPASVAQIDGLADDMGLPLPANYRAMLAEADGVSASLVQIYPAEEVPGRNADYEVARYAPGYLLIGSIRDFPVLLRGGDASPVYRNDWGDMSPGCMDELAPSLADWVARGCPSGGE